MKVFKVNGKELVPGVVDTVPAGAKKIAILHNLVAIVDSNAKPMTEKSKLVLNDEEIYEPIYFVGTDAHGSCCDVRDSAFDLCNLLIKQPDLFKTGQKTGKQIEAISRAALDASGIAKVTADLTIEPEVVCIFESQNYAVVVVDGAGFYKEHNLFYFWVDEFGEKEREFIQFEGIEAIANRGGDLKVVLGSFNCVENVFGKYGFNRKERVEADSVLASVSEKIAEQMPTGSILDAKVLWTVEDVDHSNGFFDIIGKNKGHLMGVSICKHVACLNFDISKALENVYYRGMRIKPSSQDYSVGYDFAGDGVYGFENVDADAARDIIMWKLKKFIESGGKFDDKNAVIKVISDNYTFSITGMCEGFDGEEPCGVLCEKSGASRKEELSCLLDVIRMERKFVCIEFVSEAQFWKEFS